jgi:phage-related protein
MSQQLGSVVIALKAVDECSSVMDKVKASTSLLGSAFQSMGGTMGAVGNVMQGLAAGGVAGALTAAIGETAKALKWAVGEAAQSEQAIKNLSTAVERSGKAWDSVKEGTLSALSNIQKFTVYSDEQLAAALEKLLTFGLSYDDAMKTLGKTVDFAAAKHMDLESAATIVGKAMDGNTAILKRYGVDIATTKDQTAALAAAQDAAATAIKTMGDGVATWVTNVTAAIGAGTEFEQGLTNAKDKAGFLIEQFKQGAIDLPQFATAMTSLGVPLDEVALKGGSAEAVLSKLNEQFGGAAQEQAKTYTGIQERLKNATSDLGEKIGTILLPALSGMTEAMIPIVDSMGRGVDNAQAFFTELGKAPEVKAATDALGQAFAGVLPYLENLQKGFLEGLGPALKELMSAVNEMMDAWAPVGEAFGEVFAAITGGSGDVDILKSILDGIIVTIRGFAAGMKEAAPYVKAFAEAIKTAADFIVGPIATMRSLIIGFLDALHDAFQNFYNWLVGASLWQDLWNGLVNVASAVLPGLVSMLTGVFSSLSGALAGIWDQMQTAFNTSIKSIRDALEAGWEAIKTNAISIWDEVAKRSTEIVTKLSADLTAIWGGIQGMVEAVMTGVEQTMTGIITNIKTTFESSFTSMKALFDYVVNGIQALWNQAWVNIQKIGEALMKLIQGDVSGFVKITQGFIDSMGQTITSSASNAWNAVTSTISGALDAAASAVSSFWTWLVGGSAWQNGLDLLISVTDQKMGVLAALVQSRIDEMKAAYNSAMGSPTFGAPAVPTAFMTAAQAAGASPTQAAPTPALSQPASITLPITINNQIDGATISRVIERRLIANRQLSAWRSA